MQLRLNIINLTARRCGAVLLALVLLIVYILPKDQIFSGSTSCIHRKLLNVDCPGCGMTRAIYSILHFNFKTALQLNFVAFFVLPLLAVEIAIGIKDWGCLHCARVCLYIASCASFFVLYFMRIFG